MEKRIEFLLPFFMAMLFLNSLHASKRKINWNENWRFYRGSLANVEQPDYDDSHWRLLDVPHDWSVEPAPIQKEGITIGPFSKLNEGGTGGIDIGQTLGGEGWYRKNFTLSSVDSNKRHILYVEGAYNQSEVFLNGKKYILMLMDIPLIE